MNDSQEIFIVFVSKYSGACKQISEKLNFVSPHLNTKIIDIDNPIIRNVILHSTTNKITTVPAIMMFMPQKNAIKVYEGQEVNGVLDEIVQMVNQKIVLEQQEQQTQQMKELHMQSPQRKSPSRSRDGETSIDSVLGDGDIERYGDSDESDLNQSPPEKPRRKIQKGVYASNEYAPLDEDNEMFSTAKPLPEKGVGHEGMAQSTLPEFATNENAPRSASTRVMGPDFEDGFSSPSEGRPISQERQPTSKLVKMKSGKKVEFLDDFTDSPSNSIRGGTQIGEEDLLSSPPPERPQGMSMSDIIPAGGGGQGMPVGNKENDAKSLAVKNGADAIMRGRNEYDAVLSQKMPYGAGH